MMKRGMLNSDIAKVLADLGHTDQIVIGDCGLPVPDGVKKIDLALELGFPTFEQVLRVVLTEMEVESVYIADEIKVQNVSQLEAIEALIGDTTKHFISHETFKTQSKQAKVIIRTGEITPYSNIILQSGVIF